MVRILTANLYNGRADPDAFGAILDHVLPDIVAAQEMSPEAAAVIARRMPNGLLLPALDNTGSGLASIGPIDVVRETLPHRSALVGRLVRDGISFTIWSVHLANPIDTSLPIMRRRQQVHALVRAVAEDRAAGDRIILVGDLNATPAWPAYRRLTTSLSDGVADWAARTGRRPQRTWSYRPGRRPLLRIDHALVAGVVVTEAWTVMIPGSDHRGLVVDVE